MGLLIRSVGLPIRSVGQPVRAFRPSIDQVEQPAMQIEIVTQIEVHDNLATTSLVSQSKTVYIYK